MADIRIDRYEVDVANNGETLTITDVGSLSSAFVKPIASSIKTSGGLTNTTGNINPNQSGVAIQLTATNEVTFYRGFDSGTAKVMFEVWVYTGSPGGAYEFIVRQRGNLTVANGTSGNTAAISGLSNRDNAIPVYQGFTTTENSTSDYEAVTLACHINASDEVSFSRGNNGAGSPITPYYAIPEFVGSAWNVGHAVDSSHDTIGLNGKSVTMNTDSTGSGGTAFDVGDWSTATIFERSMGGDTAETGLADCQVVTDPGSTTTTVDIRMGDNNARNDDTIYVHILQCDDLVVNRYENNNYAENNGGATYGATITVSGANGATPTSELSLEWSVSTTGTGTAWARGALVAELINSTQFRTYVHRSGNSVMVRAGIVDLSALIDAGGGVDLVPNESLHSHTAQSPTLSHSYTLSPNDESHAHTSESPTLQTGFDLSPNNGLHSQTSENPTLSHEYNLNPNEGLHNHIADTLSLEVSYTLNPNDGLHAHFSESPTLSSGASLTPNNGLHEHTSESPTLSHSYSLVPNDGNHLHTSETPLLSVSYTLSPQDGIHAHTAETPFVSSGIVLSVNEATHFHSSDSPFLTQGFVVAPNSGLIAHTSDSPSLATEYTLSPNDSNHIHLSDEPTLAFGVSLSADSGLHAHASESPTLVHKYQVLAMETNHGHIAESPTVFFSVSVVPNDGLHGHTSDSPNVFAGTSPVEILKYEVFVERNVSLNSQVDRNISSEILLTRSINMASEFTRNIKDEIFIERTIQLKSRVL